MKVITHSEEETKALAKRLTDQLKPGMTLLLEGQLGAGKTTFTKGIAEALGISRAVKSPTYTLIKEYTDGKFPLYHMDLYRLEDSEDEDLGLDDYFFGEGITVVEWGSFMKEDLPEEFIAVTIRTSEDLNDREIILSAQGDQYSEVLERLEWI
ncbi:tRNA (adenosine(37)-N6)-threonylcarbamoyltransferase complex ATPase subunit type 1 TsaE [Alkalibacterium pelagium]|uniref:tRNA threonylcarbamoyladenosine biosynthesis protein TsaE n=1 Tax=Alkalibacterium pelagium TaxID=426702 RepID=A0A1H7EVM9_9LACT|nr:tRNA (adenosine(37)-N6)-threonylcarbamoyltransferase complex ATPase subunit type 1 TsaE [Alkalibacterium pelagium]GEN49611.1 tRNA (adenosine(37)-N6)-threonylcarbamoyltransferase complex ATPase subunit type 1 TsaE [Alkalibacterium pelagium]SEK17909.1 tRNA threonylcarbamoyladenosine biosynthesis protein TsaE [Alkalibacterium pelagium]